VKKLVVDSSVIIASLLDNEPRHKEALIPSDNYSQQKSYH